MQPKQLMQFQLIKITWNDACSTSHGWVPVQDNYEPMPIESIGFVVGNSEKALTLAHSIAKTNTPVGVTDPITVPWGMVQSLEEVKLMATKSKKAAKKSTKKR